MDTAGAAFAIVGIVNGVRLLQEKSYWGFILFACALAAGVIFGLLGWFGMNLETGFLAGLGSSGLYRIGEKIGGIGQ